MKLDVLDCYGHIVGREVPSFNKAAAMAKHARESYTEVEDYPYDHPERGKRLDVWWDTHRLFDEVRKYEGIRWEARWYEKRANKARDKKDKLMAVKEKYPHL